MSLAAAKECLRSIHARAGFTRQQGNRAAEQLRRLPAYRQARTLFVSPAPALLQIRINALVDGKQLLMPGPGLKDGFYLLQPYALSFADLARAVTMQGLVQHGKRLDRQELGQLELDLLLVDAVAVDERGGRLGRGLGFFDLTCAILYELGSLSPAAQIVGVVSAAQIREDELPREPWDAGLDLLLTPEGWQACKGEGRARPVVHWEQLPEKKIRKINPLWQLYQERRGGRFQTPGTEKSSPPG